MSLTVERVSFEGFRGYTGFKLDGLGCLTVLVGPNAVGKTNIVEGIELLTAAESFRHPAWGDTISWGRAEALLSARLVDGPRDVEHRLSIRGNERVYEVNGKRRSAAVVRRSCPCVLFIPDDLQLVKAPSSRRRSALDALGARLSPAYGALADAYRQTLAQRNLLVREGTRSGPLFESWDESLAVNGGRLAAARMRLFSRLSHAMGEAYQGIVGNERLTAAYIPSWERFDAAGRQLDVPATDAGLGGDDGVPGAEEAAEKIAALSARLAETELRRRTTLSGPHKDEVAFFVDGRNARAFASQGQQRSVVLAWKLAEVAVTADIVGERPVLLLDDVMSELDESRRDALADFSQASAQTFVTTTNLGYFAPDALTAADVVELPIPGTRERGEVA